MIVATAGHVDHGKTLLVKALTGVDTDRLPEEKKRGLTIDLGFAYLPRGHGTAIGFVDVPGHENFIRNMLCGVAGVDFVLLVIAADDGPMPQTREHLAILELLGVTSGAVVVTKVDRVPRERIGLALEEISTLIAGTTLAGAPVFPVSSVNGDGVDTLRNHLDGIACGLRPRDTGGNFRLAVDRCFSLAGAGTVVTGTAMSGTLAVGAPVQALLADLKARVRSLHAQNAQSELCGAGERCALNLAGSELKGVRIARGDWIVNGPVPSPMQKIDARLRVLAVERRPLAHWTPVHVHLGAMDVTGRAVMLEGPEIAPGESGLVQLVLDRPIGALHGDRFVVRDQSSKRTIGGGRVIDVFPPVRGRARPQRLAWLASMEDCGHQAALESLLEQNSLGVNLSRFSANRNLTADETRILFAGLSMRTVETESGLLGYSLDHWNRHRMVMVDALAAWHRRFPASVGPAEDRVLDGPGIRLAPEAVMAIVGELVREGAISRSGGAVRLASHSPVLPRAEAIVWEKIAQQFQSASRLPPLVREIAEAIGESRQTTQAALERASRHGLVFRVSPNRFVLPAVARRLAAMMQELASLSGDGRVTAAAFRDRSGIGRNLTIEVLEFFDRVKFTRRVGDAREILRPAVEALADNQAPSAG